MTKIDRKYLESKFDDLGVGQLDEIDRLSDRNLFNLICEVRDLFKKFPGGVEDPNFIDGLAVTVNSYLDELDE